MFDFSRVRKLFNLVAVTLLRMRLVSNLMCQKIVVT